jgi:hypothetical protein
VQSTNRFEEVPGVRPKSTNSMALPPQPASVPIVKTNAEPEIRKALPVSTERKE